MQFQLQIKSKKYFLNLNLPLYTNSAILQQNTLADSN